MSFTPEQALEMQDRLDRAARNSRLRRAPGGFGQALASQTTSETPKLAFDGPESALHELISAELRRRRWYFVTSRMDKRSTNQVGTPDFIVAKPDGVTIWAEIKRKGSKLTPEQNITRHVLLALGHKFCVCYSMDEFLEAIK